MYFSDGEAGAEGDCTAEYYAAVNRALLQATTREETLEILSQIGAALLRGAFPK